MKKLFFTLALMLSININGAANDNIPLTINQQFKNIIAGPVVWVRAGIIASCAYVVTQNSPALKKSIPYSSILVPATFVGISVVSNLQQGPRPLKRFGNFLHEIALPSIGMALGAQHLGYNQPLNITEFAKLIVTSYLVINFTPEPKNFQTNTTITPV